MKDPNKSLIVVGGGITGLVTAFMAAREGRSVTILESSNQVGGLLRTFKVKGEFLEFYYHHFFTHDQEIRWLIDELGIEDKLIFKKTKMGIYHKGKIYDFSTKRDLWLFDPLNVLEKLRFALTSVFLGRMAKWRKHESIPAVKWLNTWAGKKVTSVIWEPLLKVKFGGLFKQIPLAWLIGRLSQRLRSRKGGDELLGYLDGSLKTLLDALVRRLEEMNVTILVNHSVQELIVEGEAILGVRAKNQSYLADKVVLTIPSAPISKLLRPHHPGLAETAGRVEYMGAVCIILELDRKLSDIYWLNIADDKMPFGGVIEHTNFIDKAKYGDTHIAYLSRYFAQNDDIANMSDEEIQDLMVPNLKKIYSAFDESWIQKVNVFKTKTAATFCDLNFSEKVLPARLPIRNLYIANMTHIYPDERSVNNSIRVAAEACRIMGIEVKSMPKGTSLSGQVGFE